MNTLILKTFKGLTPLYYKKLAQTTLVAGYHAGFILEKGRHGGATALDPKGRAPSKKQKKRTAEKRALKTRQRATSPSATKIEKAQAAQIKKQVHSEEAKRIYMEAEANIERYFGEMHLPESFGPTDYKSSRQLAPIDYPNHLKYLTTLKLKSGLPHVAKSLSSSDTPGLIVRDDGYLLTSEESRDLEATSNRAMKELLQSNDRQIKKRYAIAKRISEELTRNGLTTAPILYAKLIAVATQVNRLQDANELFDHVSSLGAELSDDIWAARIDTLVAQQHFEEASKLFAERLEKKPESECAVYVSEMNNLLKQKKYDGVKDVWMKLHDNGVKLTADAFAAAISRCTRLGEAERAFFLYDEMKIQKIEPNEAVFIQLITAAGTAPHWVNGYQDTISDALYVLESCQFVPTEGVYNAVIRAFGKAGDAVAAEYYFWEMRRKGILPTPYTYDALFEAYGTSQLVGNKSYGIYGRYVRPKPREPTKEELAYYTLGPEKVAKIMSANFYAEVEEKKGKRTKATVHELNENENEDTVDEMTMPEIMTDANFIKQQAAEQERKRLELKQQRSLQNGAEGSLLEGSVPSSTGAVGASSANSSTKRSKEEFHFAGSDSESEDDDDDDDDDDDEWEEKGMELSEDQSVKSFDSFSSKKEEEVDFNELAKDDPDLRRLIELMRKDDPDLVPALSPVKGAPVDDEELDPEEEERQLQMDPAMIALRSQSAEVANLTAQLLHSSYVMKTSNEFYDPFAHVDTIGGRKVSDFKAGLIQKYQTGEPLVQAEKTELVKMLDRMGGTEEETLALKQKQAEGSMVTQDYIDYTWDLINFGRPPYPNYDIPVEERQQQNIRRANLALQEFLNDGMKLNSNILTKYLTIYTNLGDKEGAEKVLRLFDEHGLKKIRGTYRALVMLSIRAHELDRAVAWKDEMVLTVGPDAEAYGSLIEALTHQDKVVDALKLVEEAAGYHLTMKPINLTKIRARCNTLGVYHPDLGEDPKGWVKDLKQVRREKKLSTKRGIEQIRSAFY